MIPAHSNSNADVATPTDAGASGPGGPTPAAHSGGVAAGRKKAVRFADEVAAPLDRPASAPQAPSPGEECGGAWYAQDDYDRCKREAAAHAGVAIVRCPDDKGSGDVAYVMKGNFDDAGPNAAGGGTPRYNENEYADERGPDGQWICKRGLGYHFSRSRKNSRAAARSFVLAWQGMLRDPSSDPSLGLGPARKVLTRAQRSRAMLALVSSRCSRSARDEARWRGDVDYRVAHPERHGAVRAPGGEGAVATGKRRGREVRGGVIRDGVFLQNDAGRKRRRCAAEGGGGPGGEPPATGWDPRGAGPAGCVAI